MVLLPACLRLHTCLILLCYNHGIQTICAPPDRRDTCSINVLRLAAGLAVYHNSLAGCTEKDYMKEQLKTSSLAWNTWMLVPLRLFLGATFVYAGLQKLTDPQYTNPSARGYIGRQISAFANGSPLHSWLITVALPHALFFGILVEYGELAIGLAVLLGFLLRAASLAGLCLNLVFFLSADWRISPYFYGSDIVFIFCWLTLCLAGPAHQALPALDTSLVHWLVDHAPARQRARLAKWLAWLSGVRSNPADLAPAQLSLPAQTDRAAGQAQRASEYHAWQLAQLRQESRRNFVFGSLSGGAVMLVLALLAQAFHLWPGSSSPDNDASLPGTDSDEISTVTPTLGSPVATGTPTSIATDGIIARIDAVPVNSATTFTLASNGNPAILIHLNSGQFVAFDATCTHAGCPVDYDASAQQLVCPCHGASFDPARAAAVTRGPAQAPLTSLPLKVDQSTGTVSLSS